MKTDKEIKIEQLNESRILITQVRMSADFKGWYDIKTELDEAISHIVKAIEKLNI